MGHLSNWVLKRIYGNRACVGGLQCKKQGFALEWMESRSQEHSMISHLKSDPQAVKPRQRLEL